MPEVAPLPAGGQPGTARSGALPGANGSDVVWLLDALARAASDADLDREAVHGQLVGWRRTRTWGQGELVAVGPNGRDVIARVPVGAPGNVAAAVESRCHAEGTSLATNPMVTVTGGLEVHRRYGPVRLVIQALVVDVAASTHHRATEAAIREQLAESGLLHRQQSLRLPDHIARIGVIVGGGTAAQADFRLRLQHAEDHYTLHELIVPTGGADSPEAIARAITRLAQRNLDCICLIRGGGPQVDLAAFEDPEVAVALARSPLPVLTGIGHATDSTLTDAAAHLSLPTPSAVADHIIGHNTARRTDQATAAAEHATREQRAALARLQTERHHAAAIQRRLRVALVALACLAVALQVVVLLR